MRRILLICCLVLLFFSSANATLTTIGTAQFNGTGTEYNLIYDDDSPFGSILWLDYSRIHEGYLENNWDHQMAWATGLNETLTYNIKPTYTANFGESNWRLPKTVDGVFEWGYDGTTTAGYNITTSEMGHLWYEELGNLARRDTEGNYQSGYGFQETGDFDNLIASYYFFGTKYAYDPPDVWVFDMEYGSHDYHSESDSRYVLAVHDIEVSENAIVTTTETYLTDYMTLGDTFTFDYWWEMGMEPTEGNFDVLFFNGTEWETFGWEINFDGSSDSWETASFWVPPWARGQDVQIMFSLYDWGQETDPTVYLRNINSAPVPEPATIFLIGTGLIALAGIRRKKQGTIR